MGKSSRHKTENVHHFVSFSERIANVNTDVIHCIRRTDYQTEDTFFGEALSKWTDLDLTDHFVNFRREIQGQVQTFEQLVLFKDDIIASLKTHLEISSSSTLTALLDLLVQLAKDVQQDLAPHFQEFFSILVRLLKVHSQDAEALEQIFQALAFLFRFLWRFLVKDFSNIFRYYSQLLQSSQKDYIKVFAAESCAYLLRKVKKHDELLNFLFCSLKTHPELKDGIGLLLFEMIKGVKHHFHTCSEKVFPLMLLKLGPWTSQGKQELDLPYDVVEQAITVTMHECAEHTTREHCKPLWGFLLANFKELLAVSTDHPGNGDSDSLAQQLCRLLRLVSAWLTHNNGSVVSDAQLVAETLCSIFPLPCLPETVGPDLLDTISHLLIGCHEKLSIHVILKLTSVIFDVPLPFPVLKSCVLKLQDLPFFEKDVLPRLMKKLHSMLSPLDRVLAEEALTFMVELVRHKTSSPVTGEDVTQFKKYSLDSFLSQSPQENSFVLYIDSVIQTALDGSTPDKGLAEMSVLWATITCSPHLNIKDLPFKLSSLWKTLLLQLKNCPDIDSVEMMLAVLNQLLKTMLVCFFEKAIEALPVDFKDICDIVRLRPSSLFALQTLDLYLSCPQGSAPFSEQCLVEVYTLLAPNLVSQSHHVRLITCHILSVFPVNVLDYNDGVQRESAFRTMFKAEKLVPSVHNYRDKLVHLRKMEHDMVQKCLPSELFRKAPLMFLLGNEFWNFKLLWVPLADLIASHALGLSTEDFWDVVLEQLQKAAGAAEKELQFKTPAMDRPPTSSLSDLFSSHVSTFLADTRPTDFTNFRVQLWRAMKKFPEKCVFKSDDLCQLYLNFLRNEFSAADEASLQYQNICSGNTSQANHHSATHRQEEENMELQDETIEDKMDDESEDDDEEGNEETMDVQTSGPTYVVADKSKVLKRRRAAIQSLLVHLDLFATFKKQRSLFSQPHVQNTLYELLQHKHAAVQKASFECILTYKNPHILPYRDHILNLLDDKTFKSEIVLFQVDEESTIVQEADRADLLPLLMRLLLGKFHGRAGNDTAGKSRSNLRRSIVFGFLCGCKPEELNYFLELLFQPFMQFVTDDPSRMVSSVAAAISLERFLPLKKMKGVLNTVQFVYRKLGHRIDSFAHALYQILLGLTTSVSSALTRRSQLQRGAVNLLKTLHHTLIKRLIQFLENFESLDYSREEIEALFSSVVWPQAQKIALEGVHHPTPILKMFQFWSRSSRFCPLLGHVNHSIADNYSPLTAIFSLLNAPKINSSVEAVIMELINNLLQKDEDEADEPPALPSLPEPFVAKDAEGPKIGQNFMLLHITSLLNHLQRSLNKILAGISKGRQSGSVELKILAKVSNFVTSTEESGTLSDLLISFLSRGINLSQEMEENVLLSLTNLMQYVATPETFYRTVSQLFYPIEKRHSRTLLCALFKIVSGKDGCLSKMAALIEKLNAWDRRKADEPDYSVRLAAFTEINGILAGMETPSADILLPVVHNCCHFINNVDDLSIRDNSSHCLISIVRKLATDASKTFNIIIEKTLVPQVKQGIRHKSEAVRHEYFAVLQSLIMNCPNHQLFTGLKDLCDKDPEADFFENLRHIQLHKRSRALRRLYKHLKDHSFRAEIHMSYFIPIVYSFIMDPSYAKHANIQDAAVDLLGAVCKQLPWAHYLQLLRFYLFSLSKKVEMQKQLVRVIVTLLESFHFDLRNSTYNITLAPKPVADSYIDVAVNEAEHGPNDKTDLLAQPDNTGEGPQTSAADTSLLPALPELVEDMETGLAEETGQAEEGTMSEGHQTICSSSAATRIHKTIVVSLLPQLHKIVTQKAKSDDEHKLVKSKYPEDDEILRVPIALAMIKLLQSLPAETMENMLPGILLKICAFLRSRSRDIRVTARETLEKVALSLGARFLPFILRELRSSLTRGYQLHVLSYTAYQLVKVLSTVLKAGDLDPALSSLQEVFYPELFGQVADEKEVDAIKAKYFEAKFIKGYDAYELMARYISSRVLHQLCQPLKGVLESTHSHRVANKAESVLTKIANGLMANSCLTVEALMIFINSLTSHHLCISEVHETSKTKDDESNKTKLPESCLLLPASIPRGGFKLKASKKTNVHVLVEFGLQLLNMCLKKSLLLPTEHAHLQLLDPLVPAVRDCLSSSHAKTCANAVRCLSWLLRFALPSLKENITKIVEAMFVLIQNYTGASTAKGGNQELISACFKAVTVLVREVAYYQITDTQLQVLLTYCEEDLYNFSRQSTAFNLIRAILSRKLDTPQLHQVVGKLFDMSVTSKSTSVRLQSRQVILHYLLNYPIGKNLKKHLFFYIDNLNFELDEGRESALEMMISMFSTFPQKILNNHCPKFFVALAMASFNDTSARCRKLTMVALQTLIGKIDLKRRKTLFADVVKWMKSENITVRTMGCHLCGLFVEVEGGKFEFCLPQIIPLMEELLNPERSLLLTEGDDPLRVEQEDMSLVAALNCFQKIVRDLSVIRRVDLSEQLSQIWAHVVQHLTYPHLQVRLLSCQLLGLLFSAWEPAEVAQQTVPDSPVTDHQTVPDSPVTDRQTVPVSPVSDHQTVPVIPSTAHTSQNQKLSFMLQNTLQLTRTCTKSLCKQLQAPRLDDILGTQIVKNLLYLTRLAEAIEDTRLLLWIVKKVIREANMEVINNVKITIKRNYVFKWIAAVGVTLNPDAVLSVLPHLMPPIQREMQAQTPDEDLKNLAQEVADLLKKQVGVPAFTAAFASCHKRRADKRDAKKMQQAAEAVIHPDIMARKKIKRNLKKKETLKRKMEDRKPAKRIKKNKLSILNVVVDDED